ncbi:DUF2269 family protein [Lysinibacillus sp. KU-BSD001]|uniref:DUF2269 family protein n=1 Tax=Lysinibacillus sp. KU-BSD001 TaxID=3141328 RepID=UPI0036EF4B3D
MIYKIALFIHILSAVVAIGPLFAIFPMLKRMEQADERVVHGIVEALRGAVRAVSLAGHVVIPSGLVLMWLGGWSWKTSWVLATIVVMLASLLFLAKAFKPAWRIADADGFRRDLFIKTMQIATVKYIAIMLIMLWLMVAKPQLW